MKNGKYSLVEPGSGVTVFSMEGGEINLFGSYTNIITTGIDTYPPINDSLTSKKTEDKAEQMEKEGKPAFGDGVCICVRRNREIYS